MPEPAPIGGRLEVRLGHVLEQHGRRPVVRCHRVAPRQVVPRGAPAARDVVLDAPVEAAVVGAQHLVVRHQRPRQVGHKGEELNRRLGPLDGDAVELAAAAPYRFGEAVDKLAREKQRDAVLLRRRLWRVVSGGSRLVVGGRQRWIGDDGVASFVA